MDRGDNKELQAILRELGTAMGWRVGLFWERSGAGLSLRTSWHEGEEGRVFLERSATMIFTRGIGLPGRAWHEGRPIWVEDFREVASFPRAPAAGDDDLRAALALPVNDSEDELLGVIELLGHDAERPSPDTMTTMGLIGDRIGEFILRGDDLSEALRMIRGLADPSIR